MPAGGAPDHHRAPPSAAALLRKSAPGQPWSHQETIALIEAYEEKWCSLKRGQLKAQQWEEVASDVAARCGLGFPSKTGTQCRHKIEKLRKRYRSERGRVSPSPWPYFSYMDRMERGPLPISVRTPAAAAPTLGPRGGAPSSEDEDEEDDGDDGDEDEKGGNNTRSINGILREPNWRFPGSSGNARPTKRREFEVEDEEDEEEQDDEEEEEENEDREEGGRPGVVAQLAAVVRRFGEGMMRMEKRRIEMMREVERDWMEMEAKRAEMMIESQRCLLDTITAAFPPLKKAKKSQDGL